MLTPEEKMTITAEIAANYRGLGADNIKGYLTKEGTAEKETWITIPMVEQKINIHKAVLLAAMTPQERAGLRAALAADEDFRMLYEAADEFTINHPTTIAKIDSLIAGIGLKSEVATGIKRIGQRLQSRSEELIGRNITVEEIREVIE